MSKTISHVEKIRGHLQDNLIPFFTMPHSRTHKHTKRERQRREGVGWLSTAPSNKSKEADKELSNDQKKKLYDGGSVNVVYSKEKYYY